LRIFGALQGRLADPAKTALIAEILDNLDQISDH
jgi:hypothetical protein